MINKINVGDRFYLNSFSVRKGAALPDYLIVTKFIKVGNDERAYIQAKYENCGVNTRERLFSGEIAKYSNLNPNVECPMWIFATKEEKR